MEAGRSMGMKISEIKQRFKKPYKMEAPYYGYHYVAGRQQQFYKSYYDIDDSFVDDFSAFLSTLPEPLVEAICNRFAIDAQPDHKITVAEMCYYFYFGEFAP